MRFINPCSLVPGIKLVLPGTGPVFIKALLWFPHLKRKQVANHWIKQLYMNSIAVRPDASSFSPLPPPPFPAPSLPGQSPDKTPPVRAGKTFQDPDDCSPPPRPTLPPPPPPPPPSPPPLTELPGLWKINLQHRWVTQERVLSANMDLVVNGWRHLKEIEGRMGRDGAQACTRVSVRKFAYVNIYCYKLDAMQFATS